METRQQAPSQARFVKQFVIRSAYVMSFDPLIGDITYGDVFVRDGQIVSVGSNLSADGVSEIDGSGKILLPGLIDAHTHLWSTQMRGHFKCNERDIYFRKRNLLANGYTAEDMYEGTRLGAIEAVSAGITTLYDFCHNVRNSEFAMRSIAALKESGLRACF